MGSWYIVDLYPGSERLGVTETLPRHHPDDPVTVQWHTGRATRVQRQFIRTDGYQGQRRGYFAFADPAAAQAVLHARNPKRAKAAAEWFANYQARVGGSCASPCLATSTVGYGPKADAQAWASTHELHRNQKVEHVDDGGVV